MGLRRQSCAIAVVACVGLLSTACRGGHSAHAGDDSNATMSPKPPTMHAEIALYNDTSSSVRVLGCRSCGASGAALDPGRRLSLNMPGDKIRLTIRQPTRTTCFMIVDGVDTGKPLQLKVSDSAATAC